MTGSNNKRRLVLVAASFAILILSVLVAWYFGAGQVKAPEPAAVELPSDNRKAEIPGGYLYASNDELDRILPRVDTQLKAQGLNGDMDSEAFDYPDEATEGVAGGVQSCVEFKYFKAGTEAATLTLVPEDPACSGLEASAQQRIRQLHQSFDYVYFITATL